MTYLKKENLKYYKKGFKMNIVKKIAIQLLKTIQFLSQNKIIHCDLKP